MPQIRTWRNELLKAVILILISMLSLTTIVNASASASGHTSQYIVGYNAALNNNTEPH
ncbi:MAG: hypothetical protein WAM14_11145 [Candidatus Nitrosopolaris sp.]